MNAVNVDGFLVGVDRELDHALSEALKDPHPHMGWHNRWTYYPRSRWPEFYFLNHAIHEEVFYEATLV